MVVGQSPESLGPAQTTLHCPSYGQQHKAFLRRTTAPIAPLFWATWADSGPAQPDRRGPFSPFAPVACQASCASTRCTLVHWQALPAAPAMDPYALCFPSLVTVARATFASRARSDHPRSPRGRRPRCLAGPGIERNRLAAQLAASAGSTQTPLATTERLLASRCPSVDHSAQAIEHKPLSTSEHRTCRAVLDRTPGQRPFLIGNVAGVRLHSGLRAP
jgi:hypothetical protein